MENGARDCAAAWNYILDKEKIQLPTDEHIKDAVKHAIQKQEVPYYNVLDGSKSIMPRGTLQDATSGYKVFKGDWTCLGKQYSCPGTFHEDGPIKLCERGMHFCTSLIDCFRYYPAPREKYTDYHVCEVIGFGTVLKSIFDTKCVCSDMMVVREIEISELWLLANSGLLNVGVGNTGSANNGCNNSGDSNVGDYNVGDCNDGNANVGNHNIGNYNIGDFNLGDWHNGCFCTSKEQRKIWFFDRPSDWTYADWATSLAYQMLDKIPRSNTSDCQRWWDECLSDSSKLSVLELPNFDPDIFEKCTGICTKTDMLRLLTIDCIEPLNSERTKFNITVKFKDGHTAIIPCAMGAK